jgi:hypothetical protein
VDLRLGRLSFAGLLAIIAALLLAAPAGAQQPQQPQPQPKISQSRAIEIARLDPKAVSATEQHPNLAPTASRNSGTGLWEVGFFSGDEQLVQVVVDPNTGKVVESWTGYQVAWRMARGYPGAFGRMINAPYIWLPLCAIFVLGLLDWRRPFRLAHLDLLVVVAGFGLSHYFFNQGNIGLSVPLARRFRSPCWRSPRCCWSRAGSGSTSSIRMSSTSGIRG